ncbi:cyclophilin-like fold protein [Azospirillum brasilense]|uniref:cyclophilin-like fold protein n=1 Tax=Azospirillum brasilense TaxID=192 RepID=UPI003D7E91FB
MTAGTFSPLRRRLLGGLFATAVLPLPASAKKNDPAGQEPTDMTIKLTFNGRSVTATLHDNPTARNLLSLLPLDLTIANYGNNEKVAYLPRKLTEEASGSFSNEMPGDLCYYAPWGNLAMFYAGYQWSQGLIRLGRFDNGFEPLLMPGKFPLHIERVPSRLHPAAGEP